MKFPSVFNMNFSRNGASSELRTVNADERRLFNLFLPGVAFPSFPFDLLKLNLG